MKKIILYLSVITASGLMMVTVYYTLIDARIWSADIPRSVETARIYYSHLDPRTFFSLVAPINQLLVLSLIILFWKDRRLRLYFSLSFVLYACIFLLTLYYFIPRDVLIFSLTSKATAAEMRSALLQWQVVNPVRSLLGLTGIFFTCRGIHHYYVHKRV
ncbi:MAG: DUF1772 domain-containing protein [Niabella sp.]|nr:DUF1772 domain-containing protein [Niabella sp.]